MSRATHTAPGVLLLVFAATLASPSGATTDDCLAGICLSDTLSSVEKRIGRGHSFPPELEITHCFKVSEKGPYVSFVVSDEDPARPVMAVVITDRPYCPSASLHKALPPAATCDGVSIGDSSEVVRKRHGEPMWQGSPHFPWSDAPAGIEQWDYHCDDAVGLETYPAVTSIFFRDGFVIGVSIWSPDG